MIAYATNCTDPDATTGIYDYDDDGTASEAHDGYGCGILYLVFSTHVDQPSFDDAYFAFIRERKEASKKRGIVLSRVYLEHYNRLQIAMMFNIYAALFNRRMMFPKSGFLARAGKKRRN